MPWETDQSSNFLSAFRGKVTDEYFSTDPKYNDGNTLLYIWQLEVLEVHQDGYEGEIPEPHTVSLTIGDGWETQDGKTVEHTKNKDRFHASSLYGKLIDAIIASDPDYDGPATGNYGKNAERTDGEDLEVDFGELAKVLVDRGDPTEAEVFHDLVFDFVEILFDYGPDRKGEKGDRIQSRRSLPLRYVPDEAPAARKAPAKKAAARKAAAPAKSAADKAREKAAAKKAEKETPVATSVNGEPNFFVEVTNDLDTAVALMNVLKAADDYDAFVEAAIDIDAVSANDNLLEFVVDESDTGPWARKAELA